MDDINKLREKVEELGEGLKFLYAFVYADRVTGVGNLNERQVKLVKGMISLFQDIRWMLKFDNHKELRYDHSPVIKKDKCGTPVKVRSCKEGHGDKTYFGILLGDIALSISHSIDDDGNVTAKHTLYNPAIFIPELNDIVYGMESWWGEITSEEELNKMITDKTISNVWYVKMLTSISKPADTENEE